MTGLYPGRFSGIGYYIKVREYNDHDSRDLWNYPLNLTPEQVWMLVAHLWELDNTWFAYFFRTENCSYQILSLIEAVVPEIDLLPNRLSAVVPIETIIDAMNVDGFIGEPTMSPALRRQFQARIEPMDRESRKAVAALQKDATAPLPDSLEKTDQAAVLDAAADLIEIRFPNEILLDEPTPEAEHRQQILSRRAQMGVTSPPLRFSPASVEDPTRGHGRHRFGLEGGLSVEGQPYGRIHYRAALHDWADPALGYPELEQIEFLPFTLWVDPAQNVLRLEQLSFLRTRSLQPFNRFHRRPSTTMDAGIERATNRGCNDCVGAYFQSGNGLAVGTPTHRWVGFIMGQTRLWAIPNLTGIAATPLHLGVGTSTGFRVRISKRITALVEAEVLYYPWQEHPWVWQGEGDLRWGIGSHMAMGVHGLTTPFQTNAGLQLFTYW